MSFEEMLKATLVPAVREAVRAEVRAMVAEMKPPQDGLLTTKAAAKLAGVDPKTIRDWKDRGWLPSHWAGNKLRIDPAELRECMASKHDLSGDVTPESIAEAILNPKKDT